MALWIVSGLFSTTVLNFTVNARSFLLVVPPAAILLVRRLRPITATLNRKCGSCGRLCLRRLSPWALPWLIIGWPIQPEPGEKNHRPITNYRIINYGSRGIGGSNTTWKNSAASPLDLGLSLLQPGDVAGCCFGVLFFHLASAL